MGTSVEIAGLPVRELSPQLLIRFLDGRCEQRKPLAIGFVNHHFAVACRHLAERASTTKNILLVNDGIGVDLASWMTRGSGFAANMNGTDFVPRFLRQSRRELSVYLVGGTRDVVQSAAKFVDRIPNCRVVGYIDGFSLWGRERDVIDSINSARPDVLLIGMGSPLQEAWILQNMQNLGATLTFAVGALFDWMTGARTRAPYVLRLARLEWLYRLMLEPRRLAGRYTVEVLFFFYLVLRPKRSPTI